MQTVLMPYTEDKEFVVEITYEGGSQLQASNNKLMDAIKEAEGMVTFGLGVKSRRILRKTKHLINQGGIHHRVFEVFM